MSNLLRIIYAMIAHTIILRHRVYGFHSRNHGFLTSRMAVSKTPDTGVTEPGIFNDFSRMAIKGSSQRVSIIGGMEQFQNYISTSVVIFYFL